MKLTGDASSFEIRIIHANPYNADNAYDNWIKASLNIKLPGFTSEQYFELMYFDLEIFFKSVKEALQDFSIPITFNTLEDSVALEGKIQTHGQVIWSGYSIYPVGIGNKLSFEFETGLAQVDNLFSDLQRIEINKSDISN